jgi:hypothetical protein
LFKNIGGDMSTAFSGVKNMFGALGGLFGGFLAAGGDVAPGHAYVVGEKHAEWFVPKVAGQVAPALTTQQTRPVHFEPHWHIQTPDVDSFKRSQSQVTAAAYRAFALAHSRNS